MRRVQQIRSSSLQAIREDETRTSNASYTETPERRTIPRRLTKIVPNLCTSLAD